jgi:hypothetical protein
LDDITHWPLALQQPVQVVPPHVQAPPLHELPDAHAPQAFPPEPHVIDDWPDAGTQVAPLQHPFGQEVELHTHAPCGPQACPFEHAVHAAPAVPHCIALSLA